MTIRLPKKTWVDLLLKRFGYERQIKLPEGCQEIKEKFGPFVQVRAKWQSLWETIRRK